MKTKKKVKNRVIDYVSADKLRRIKIVFCRSMKQFKNMRVDWFMKMLEASKKHWIGNEDFESVYKEIKIKQICKEVNHA